METYSIARVVRKKIEKIEEGEIFDYSLFPISRGDLALAKILSRLTKEGRIVRAERGKYYKPRRTVFGALRPKEEQLIKSLTSKEGKIIGYLTGVALYNQLGITTQVSNVITIATKRRLPSKKISGYQVKYILRSFDFKQRDIPFLQLLDSLRDIRDIPDVSSDKALSILIGKIKELSYEGISQMIKLSFEYNPATRALLGAIIDLYFPIINSNTLLNSLNPLSKYKLKISEATLSNKSKWAIE